MVGQQLPQTNEKCYSVLQCPMWPFLPPFYESKHSPGMSCLRLRIRNLKGQQLVGPSRCRSRILHGILVYRSFQLRSGAGWDQSGGGRRPVFAAGSKGGWAHADSVIKESWALVVSIYSSCSNPLFVCSCVWGMGAQPRDFDPSELLSSRPVVLGRLIPT